MQIIADKNIPLVKQAFCQFGDVLLLDAGSISREIIRKADILLVRSETKIDEILLADSTIRFVGSATSGIDHVDLGCLKQEKIEFAYAPGSNANSVAEYVATSLLWLSQKFKIKLEGKSIGVIGVGHVGSRVAEMANALGLTVLLNDPPKAQQFPSERFLPLDELMECDILTLHVPLTKRGPHATAHLFSSKRFEKIKKKCIFINASRGEVVESKALKQAIGKGIVQYSIIDVWENEPEIDLELLEMASVTSPHIAGYAFDGKVSGTRMLYRAATDFFNVTEKWQPDAGVENRRLTVPALPAETEEVLHAVIQQVYDVKRDDRDLRRIVNRPIPDRADYFRQLRRKYRFRREFHNFSVGIPSGAVELAQKLKALGFLCEFELKK